MYFNIDYATEDFVDGWLTPDNPTVVPRFMIETESDGHLILPANIYRPDLVNAGLHDTGLVGFRFDGNNVPGFTSQKRIKITELTHKKIIYHRDSSRAYINRKIFLFNNISVPSQYLRVIAGSQFLASYSAIDEVGIETAGSLLRNKLICSIFAEGRLHLAKHFRKLKEDGYYVSALLEDPYIELANRLLVVRFIMKSNYGGAALDTLSPFYSALKECVKNLEEITINNINFIFTNLSQVQKQAVTDPLTRLLGCADNEEPEPRHVSSALGILAEFSSVCTVSKIEYYKSILSEDMPQLNISEMNFINVGQSQQLAQILSQSVPVKKLLRNDVRLYSYIDRSLDHAMSS